jgi:Tfp pilus assembly protein PilO
MPSLKTQIHWFTRIQQALVGAVLVTGIVFYSLVYRPETGRLQTLTSRISERESELSTAESQARVAEAVQADINRLQEKLADFKKLPANPGDLGQFQIDMAQLARRDNLNGWSVSWPGTPKRDEQYYELPISLKFAGDFTDVFSFLRQMEDLSRLTRVKSLTIRGDDAAGQVQVELMMNLYYSEG